MRTNRLYLALGCAALIHAGGASAASAEYNLSGFLDSVYTGVNDLAPSTESKFSGLGELDIGAKSPAGKVGGLLDLNFLLNSANQGVARIEQAYINWDITDRLGLDVGAMNSGLGLEKEDPTDLLTITHGQLYTFFDNQTSGLYGNNIEGVFLNGSYNRVNARFAFLNDLGDTASQNSVLLQAGADIINGLNVQGSFITQHAQAGNIFDINSTYRRGPVSMAVEVMTAEQTVDYGWGGTGHIDIGSRYGITGRIDHIKYANNVINADTSYTIAGIWNALENFQVYMEYRADDNGKWNSQLTLQGLARFL